MINSDHIADTGIPKVQDTSLGTSHMKEVLDALTKLNQSLWRATSVGI